MTPSVFLCKLKKKVASLKNVSLGKSTFLSVVVVLVVHPAARPAALMDEHRKRMKQLQPVAQE